MGTRTEIGIIYSYNENWIGGTYYILNIIRTLCFLDDAVKPLLYIITEDKSGIELIEEINYPFIEYIQIDKNPIPKWKRGINKISKKIAGKSVFDPVRRLDDKVEIVFPANFSPYFEKVSKKIHWIPDFQERYLPHFFEEQEIQYRKRWQEGISLNGEYLIFSSNTCLNDFDRFFPQSKIKKGVFRFSSILPEINKSDLDTLLEKYNLPSKNYFFSPNQFWQHKNHIIVLKALKSLKEQNQLNFKVYFSGKENDYRNPGYFLSLQEFVKQNHLEDDVKFLGFIDRTDQLSLMKHAIAVIQPSLFEGWSTVVEDTKALNQKVVVSNIEVHKEQLGDKGYYFDPNSEDSLIEQILEVKKVAGVEVYYDYQGQIVRSAADFLSIIESFKMSEN